jgi:hypothetical protein
MKQKLLQIILLSIMVIFLTACNVRIATTIEESGAGQYGFEMGFTPGDQDALEDLDSSPEQFCQEMQTGGDLPPGASLTVEQRDEDIYCVMTQPFTSLTELRSLYSEGSGITVNALDIADNTLTYDIDMVMNEDDTTGAGFVDMAWQVTVPGTVSKHNADSVNGNTLTWVLVPGESRNIHVESSVGGLLDGNSIFYIVSVLCSCLCCLVLLAAAGGGVYWFRQRSKIKAEAV